MASEKILNQKKEEVSKLATEMKEAKLILLTDYRGITVEGDTELRRNLRNANANARVIKNNITRRALAEAGIEGLEDKLVGPTAVILSNEDYLEPSKVIYNFTKSNDFYKIKGGVVDGKVMTADEIITLAKLPSREDLLSMLAGALLANISKVAVALNEVRKQKEEAGEKVTVSVPAEEVKEEATPVAEAETPAETTETADNARSAGQQQPARSAQ